MPLPLLTVVALALVATDPRSAQTGPAPSFKVAVTLRDSKDEIVETGQILAHRGRLYQHLSSTEEVVVVDPDSKVIRIVAIRRRLMASLRFDELKARLDALNKTWTDRAEVGAKGGRADRIEAEAIRNLIEPHYTTESDDPAHRVRLSNPSLQIEATGEPEPDPARLALLATGLRIFATLPPIRNEEDYPPTAALAAIDALMTGRRLRPKELRFRFQVAGKPTRHRLTYTYSDDLTDRDRAAIDRIDELIGRWPAQPLDRYDRSMDAQP